MKVVSIKEPFATLIKEKKKYVLVYCTNGDPKKTGIIEIDGKPWSEDLGKIDLFTSKYNSYFS